MFLLQNLIPNMNTTKWQDAYHEKRSQSPHDSDVSFCGL